MVGAEIFVRIPTSCGALRNARRYTSFSPYISFIGALSLSMELTFGALTWLRIRAWHFIQFSEIILSARAARD